MVEGDKRRGDRCGDGGRGQEEGRWTQGWREGTRGGAMDAGMEGGDKRRGDGCRDGGRGPRGWVGRASEQNAVSRRSAGEGRQCDLRPRSHTD